MSINRFERVKLDNWQTDSLRMTAFPILGSPSNDPGWWSILADTEPTTETTKPKEGISIREGLVEKSWFVNQNLPNRIDWILTCPPDTKTLFEFPSIGDVSSSVKLFSELMNKWLKLDSCPQLQRIAVGSVFNLPVEGRIEGYKQIQPYLPSMSLDPNGSSDFSYQINRPRKLTSIGDGLLINRLSKWFVAHLLNVGFRLDQSSSIDTREGQYVCRIEIDINTDAFFKGTLPKEQLTNILNTLLDFTKEIVTNGDIP